MIHHHHHQTSEPPEAAAQEFCEACAHGRNHYFLAGSILAAAVLVSASMFYNVRLILKYQDTLLAKGFAAAGQAAQNAAGDSAGGKAQGNGSAAAEVAARSDAPVLGNRDAKVAIYEFSDFQCPYCQKFFNGAFGDIKAKYLDTGKAKLIFRHYPLPFHVNAQKAAEAAECANRQGKFWPYHDLLFKNGQADGANLDTASLKKYADQLNLNNGTLGFGKNKFNQCLDGGQAADTVKKDASDGSAAGVSGTPTFYINGAQVVGAQPAAVFEQAIEAALKK